MADNLTDLAENALLDHLFATATLTITGPIKLALSTTAGSDATAGTEVTGGSTSNSGTVTFTGMPACTVVGIEIYDSNGTPKRLAYGALTASKTVGAGDTLTFAAASISLSLA